MSANRQVTSYQGGKTPSGLQTHPLNSPPPGERILPPNILPARIAAAVRDWFGSLTPKLRYPLVLRYTRWTCRLV